MAKCTYCSGTRKSIYGDKKCNFCFGTGYETAADINDTALPGLAILSIVIMVISFVSSFVSSFVEFVVSFVEGHSIGIIAIASSLTAFLISRTLIFGKLFPVKSGNIKWFLSFSIASFYGVILWFYPFVYNDILIVSIPLSLIYFLLYLCVFGALRGIKSFNKAICFIAPNPFVHKIVFVLIPLIISCLFVFNFKCTFCNFLYIKDFMLNNWTLLMSSL